MEAVMEVVVAMGDVEAATVEVGATPATVVATPATVVAPPATEVAPPATVVAPQGATGSAVAAPLLDTAIAAAVGHLEVAARAHHMAHPHPMVIIQIIFVLAIL